MFSRLGLISCGGGGHVCDVRIMYGFVMFVDFDFGFGFGFQFGGREERDGEIETVKFANIFPP